MTDANSDPRSQRPLVVELLARTARPFRKLGGRVMGRLEQTLHPVRRRRAVRKLRDAGPLDHILVLCHGNVCRSPYVERRLRMVFHDRNGDAGEDPPRVTSAGWVGPGRPADSTARRVAAERGVDLAGHESQLLPPACPAPSTLVVVMTGRQARRAGRVLENATIVHLGDLDTDAYPRRDIEDPWGKSADAFERIFDRLDRAVDRIASTWDRA